LRISAKERPPQAIVGGAVVTSLPDLDASPDFELALESSVLLTDVVLLESSFLFYIFGWKECFSNVVTASKYIGLHFGSVRQYEYNLHTHNIF
jgi:hypothetical protein